MGLNAKYNGKDVYVNVKHIHVSADNFYQTSANGNIYSSKQERDEGVIPFEVLSFVFQYDLIMSGNIFEQAYDYLKNNDLFTNMEDA